MGSTAGLAPSAPAWRGSLIAFALVADLIVAGGLALVIAPVTTTEAALSGYDSLPDPVRAALGDEPDTATAGADQAARGPIGSWLADFHREALESDLNAQVERAPDVTSDLMEGGWTARAVANVSWPVYGDEVGFETAVTEGPHPPLGPAAWTPVPVPGTAAVPIGPGTNHVHVRATLDDRTGPAATLGPFLVDRTPPPSPTFVAGTSMRVDDYSFDVDWDPVTDESGIQGYRLERSTTGLAYERAATLDASTTEWTERNRPNGDYYFRVRAVNGAGVLSEPGSPLRVTVDASSNLPKPDTGSWDYGIHATYDSIIHVWDISDPSKYLDLSDVHGPEHGGLSQAEYQRYLGPGWGVTIDNETLRGIAREIVGSETNTLSIAMATYAWLFDATDYDFEKFAATESNFLKANEVYDLGRGICGDLTSLYITMLRIAGVPARPVHGYLINQEDGIGGFHMWAEVYVGGQAHDATGDGWLVVDVSGVTGSFEPRYFDIYFGVSNPSYLQLGIQDDLGVPNDPDAPNSKWNVWANLRWEFIDDGTEPNVHFNADATVTEDTTRSVSGRLYFDPATHRRQFCDVHPNGELVEPSCGDGFRTWYDGLQGRSVRDMDYGADLSWNTNNVNRLWLNLKAPETPGPNQAVIFTVYEHDASCRAREIDLGAPENGFLTWEIDGSREPCSR